MGWLVYRAWRLQLSGSLPRGCLECQEEQVVVQTGVTLERGAVMAEQAEGEEGEKAKEYDGGTVLIPVVLASSPSFLSPFLCFCIVDSRPQNLLCSKHFSAFVPLKASIL